jgi:hypothetical protein
MLPSSGEWRVDTPSCCSRTYARTHARARARAYYGAHARTHAEIISLFCNEGLRTCFPPLESGASTLLLVAHAHTHARTHMHLHAHTMAHTHARMQKGFFYFLTRVFAHASLLWRVARRHSFLLLTHIRTHARTRTCTCAL